MEQQERYYLEQRLIPEILYSEECSRFIRVNGKTSDFNPGMKENTLFPRSFFFVELVCK